MPRHDQVTRHPRTIRRDLEALEAAHIPLITERSNGRTRWRLMDGYRQVLPLTLSPNLDFKSVEFLFRVH